MTRRAAGRHLRQVPLSPELDQGPLSAAVIAGDDADAARAEMIAAGLGVPAGDAALLDEVAGVLARYVAFPSDAARDAVALWAVHCHVADAFESTPRLALLSPEKGSGKTRCLEVLDGLVPNPMHAVNCTAAALFRAVAGKPTLLFDECDTYFGPRAAKDHEELRGLINAGHRRGAVAYRCVGEPSKMEVRAFPAFTPAALAGIGDLPDTVLDRAVVVKMRRRAPHERVEPFRQRLAGPVLGSLRDRLAAWAKTARPHLAGADPAMPDGIVDRAADVWEPLVAVADACGGDWPARARRAAVELNAARQSADTSLGARLLADLKVVFATADRLWTEDVLSALTGMDEAPWGDLRGKKLDARGLAARLRRFDVRPADVRIGDTVKKGYRAEDLHDAWVRYLPASPSPEEALQALQLQQRRSEGPEPVADEGPAGATSATRSGAGDGTGATTGHVPVADVALPLADAATEPGAVTSGVALVADVAPPGGRERDWDPCGACGAVATRYDETGAGWCDEHADDDREGPSHDAPDDAPGETPTGPAGDADDKTIRNDLTRAEISAPDEADDRLGRMRARPALGAYRRAAPGAGQLPFGEDGA